MSRNKFSGEEKMKLELIKPDLTKPYKIRFVMPIAGPALIEDLRRDYQLNPEDAVYFYKGALEHIGIDVRDPKLEIELEEIAKGKKKMQGSSDTKLEIVPE